MTKIQADLHIHSCYSDGEPTPREILMKAVQKKLRVISITDHNTFLGSVEAIRLAKEKKIDILVLIGNEVRTLLGDVLLYCSAPIEIKPYPDLDELSDIADESGCIAVPAHPFDRVRKGIGAKGLELLGKKLYAIECYNAFSSKLVNDKAHKYAEFLGKKCLANSDAHTLKAIGAFSTIMELDLEEGFEGFRKAIISQPLEPNHHETTLLLYLDKWRWSLARRIKPRECF